MKKEYHKLLILSIIGISALNFNVNLRENINNQGNIFISQDNTSDVIVDEIISESVEIDSSNDLEKDELEMLQDMIVVAINEAITLVNKEEQKILAKQQANMRLPF